VHAHAHDVPNHTTVPPAELMRAFSSARAGVCGSTNFKLIEMTRYDKHGMSSTHAHLRDR
jgi:hypothetical protein